MATISHVDDHERNKILLTNWKKFYPTLDYVQSLEAHDLGRVAEDKHIHWDKIVPLHFAEPSPDTIDDKTLAIGILVYDCLCLCIGAVGLAASLKVNTAIVNVVATNIYKAAEQSVPKIVQIARQMGQSSDSLAKGWKTFEIIWTLKDGMQLDTVWNAFLGSLTWYSALLYGMQGLVTIFAAVATGGASLVAQIILIMIGMAFLVTDVMAVLKAFDQTEEQASNLKPVGSPDMAYRSNVAIKTFSGNYLTFVNNGGIGTRGYKYPNTADIIHTDAREVGAWETLKIVPIDMTNKTFAFKTSSGKYLTAVKGGGMGSPAYETAPVHTNATSIGAYEKLVTYGNTTRLGSEHGNGPAVDPLYYAIGTSSDYFLTIEGGGGRGSKDNESPLHTNATTIGDWETFEIVPVIS